MNYKLKNRRWYLKIVFSIKLLRKLIIGSIYLPNIFVKYYILYLISIINNSMDIQIKQLYTLLNNLSVHSSLYSLIELNNKDNI